MIIKKYKESGKIFEKKEDKIKREHLEEYKALNDLATQPSTPIAEVPIPFYFYMPIAFPEIIGNDFL